MLELCHRRLKVFDSDDSDTQVQLKRWDQHQSEASNREHGNLVQKATVQVHGTSLRFIFIHMLIPSLAKVVTCFSGQAQASFLKSRDIPRVPGKLQKVSIDGVGIEAFFCLGPRGHGISRIMLFAPHTELVLGQKADAKIIPFAKELDTTIDFATSLAGTLASVCPGHYQTAVAHDYHSKQQQVDHVLVAICRLEPDLDKSYQAVRLQFCLMSFMSDTLKLTHSAIGTQARIAGISAVRRLIDLYHTLLDSPTKLSAFKSKAGQGISDIKACFFRDLTTSQCAFSPCRLPQCRPIFHHAIRGRFDREGTVTRFKHRGMRRD